MKKLLLYSFLLVSLLAKATTINSVCHGNWSNPNTWDNGTTPTSIDTINVSHNVLLDVNVTLSSTGILIIQNAGSLCGNHNFDGKSINNGPMNVNMLTTHNSVSNAWLSAVGSTVNGLIINNGACLSGCPPTCGLPIPCHPINTYTVNTPLYDTLNSAYAGEDTTNYGACYPLFSQEIFVSPSVFPYATGVKLYFLINNINAVASSVTATPGGVVHAGDTLPLPTLNPSGGYQFYFSQGGSLQLYLIAMGTPTSPGQQYSCGWNTIVKSYNFCQDSVVFYSDTTTNCNVRMQATIINSKLIMNDIYIYPNPTTNQFFIETNTTEKLTLNLYDINSRQVLSKIVNDKSSIDVTALDEGVYTLTIKTAEGVVNKKLVILR